MNDIDSFLKEFQLVILDDPKTYEPLEKIFYEIYENVTLGYLSEDYQMGYSKLCFLISAYLMTKFVLFEINLEEIKKEIKNEISRN